jgi:hypothetical protein
MLMRHPWCRYEYMHWSRASPFARYGIEQQAEIVRHVFLYQLGLLRSRSTRMGDAGGVAAVLIVSFPRKNPANAFWRFRE